MEELISSVLEYTQRVKGAENEAEIRDALKGFLSELLGKQLELKEIKIEKKLTHLGFYVGRADLALDGVVIEVKRNIQNKKQKADALEQVEKYLNTDQYRKAPFGIITDGINFEVYERENLKRPVETFSFPQVEDKKEAERVLYKLGKYILIEGKVPLNAQSIIETAGYYTVLYRTVHRRLLELYEAVRHKKEVDLKFSKWRLYLSFVYGRDVEDDLFFRHTYLSILVKILSAKLLGFGTGLKEHTLDIVSGRFFEGVGIKNYIEKDFYSWVFEENIREDFRDLVGLIFDFLERKFSFEGLSDVLEEDLLKELYQNIVSKQERQLLGEYYTPDWLVQKVIEDTLTDPYAKVIDPSCGSGSFLFFAIKKKRELLKDLSPQEKLRHILQSVVGIDINPIATLIARTNYLLALGEQLLKERRDFEIEIPVYTADSLQSFVSYEGSMYGDIIEIEIKLNKEKKGEEEKSLNKEDKKEVRKLFLPFYRDASWINRSIDALTEYALSEARDFKDFVRRDYAELLEFPYFEKLTKSAEALREVVQERGNSIWKFILKNIHRPIFLKESFDLVVGNPPWISYNRMNTNMQNFVESFIKGNNIRVSAHTKTSFDFATVFFVVCMREYLKDQGRIAFVLPHSFLVGDQNEWIRRKEAFERFKFYPLKVYDIREVEPLFNQASCVLIAQKGNHKQVKIEKVPALIFKGKLPYRNSGYNIAVEKLQIEEDFLYISKGKGHYWTYKKQENSMQEYESIFKQGATIVPRSFWFIETEELPIGGKFVRSKKFGDEKIPVELNGFIPEEFFFKTLLSKRMYPFGWTELDEVFLPIKIEQNRYKLLDYYEIVSEYEDASERFWKWLENTMELRKNVREWLSKAQKEWEKSRGGKYTKINIIDRLNYMNGITNQPVRGGYLVLYTTSGTNPCACVMEKDERFVADTTTYYATLDSFEHALYLCAFINSSILAQRIRLYQAQGQFGERHIHKLLVKQPIPLFDPNNPLHIELVKVASKAHQKASRQEVKEWLKTIPQSRIRTYGRHILAFELNKIDTIAADLLGEEKPLPAIGVALFTHEEDEERLKRVVSRFLEDEGLDLKVLSIPPQVLLIKYNPIEDIQEILEFAKSSIDFVGDISETVNSMALMYRLSGKLLRFLKEKGIRAHLIRRKGDKKEVITTEEEVHRED